MRRFSGNWKTCVLHCPFLGSISCTSPFRYKVPYYGLHLAAGCGICGWFATLRPGLPFAAGLPFVVIPNYFPHIDPSETNATISPMDSGFKRLIHVARPRPDDHLPLHAACVSVHLDLASVPALPRWTRSCRILPHIIHACPATGLWPTIHPLDVPQRFDHAAGYIGLQICQQRGRQVRLNHAYLPPTFTIAWTPICFSGASRMSMAMGNGKAIARVGSSTIPRRCTGMRALTSKSLPTSPRARRCPYRPPQYRRRSRQSRQLAALGHVAFCLMMNDVACVSIMRATLALSRPRLVVRLQHFTPFANSPADFV
jgi:hypothetical protein